MYALLLYLHQTFVGLINVMCVHLWYQLMLHRISERKSILEYSSKPEVVNCNYFMHTYICTSIHIFIICTVHYIDMVGINTGSILNEWVIPPAWIGCQNTTPPSPPPAKCPLLWLHVWNYYSHIQWPNDVTLKNLKCLRLCKQEIGGGVVIRQAKLPAPPPPNVPCGDNTSEISTVTSSGLTM